ncbi:Synaptojanin-1 [Dactylellina cionopaga]|nr:Synaptojanin-1 [Dactylellina cionopaga]
MRPFYAPQKSVSTLRSRFEHSGVNSPSTSSPTVPLPLSRDSGASTPVETSSRSRFASSDQTQDARVGRPTSILRRDNEKPPLPVGSKPDSTLKTPVTPGRSRPLSIGGLRSTMPPTVTIDSPKSPPKQPLNGSIVPPPVPSPRGSKNPSPSRTPPPPVAPRPKSLASKPDGYFTQDATAPEFSISQKKAPLSQTMQALRDYPTPSALNARRNGAATEPLSIPPPRPARSRESLLSRTSTEPVQETKPIAVAPPPPPPPSRLTVKTNGTRSLAPSTGSEDERLSPFSTPPSDDEASTIVPIPVPTTNRLSKQFESYSPFSTPPPVHHTIAEKRVKPPPPPPPSNPSRPTAPKPSFAPPPLTSTRDAPRASISLERPRASISQERSRSQDAAITEFRPSLPPRPSVDSAKAVLIRGRSSSPPKPSMIASPHVDASELLKMPPPPKRIQSNLKSASPARGSVSHGHSYSVDVTSVQPTMSLTPSIRSASISSTTTAMTSRTATTTYTRDADDDDSDPGAPSSDPNEYPDSSGANRRKPVFKTGPMQIQSKNEVKLFAVCGQYVCTTSHVTAVWNLQTGEQIMALNHGETSRITAIAFKPSADINTEGSVLWLGNQFGELMEIDIRSHRLVESRSSAHTKREIVKIHRHGYELWSLDDSGKLQVWPPDAVTNEPNLRGSPRTFRVKAGHSYSLVAGSQLWLASGRDVMVYQPSADPGVGFHLVDRPISQLKHCGEITSGALINSAPDKVFFGHSDGKVSIYSRKTLTCIDVVSVSLYKINTMSGVGDYLWAGYQTGMIYVYDVSSRPWKVIKDWSAHHQRPITELIVDRSSIWKVDRLQVASLSSEMVIKVWDGMMEDDWLEEEMQKRDTEFCDFRQVKTLICTWNAGASKPSDLRSYRDNDKYIANVLSTCEGDPDIIVFGFQELVDLENKKLTAKSIFKGKKSEKHLNAGVQEHMSRQYRVWQEYLAECIEKYMQGEVKYQMLHSANMVGLFTCIFVKASERGNIRNFGACTVKTGLKGIHGNKGALVTRFFMDDSSVCFVNCHLAAGQSGTRSRNNDIADILEASNLTVETDPNIRAYSFVGGGDGSRILDHEICILNGDLNYRIEHSHRDNVINTIRNGDFEKLLDRDQLLIERKKNPGFRLRSFQEAPITFAPTYKYDVGTDTFDSSEKKRIPSWCDRVLYRGLRVQQLDYRRHEVHTSDHRPVSAVFSMRVKTVEKRKREGVMRSCEKRYAEVKLKHVWDAKLDYLINVCGYPPDLAQKSLAKEAQRHGEASKSAR